MWDDERQRKLCLNMAKIRSKNILNIKRGGASRGISRADKHTLRANPRGQSGQ
jgi:hypothetical protein